MTTGSRRAIFAGAARIAAGAATATGLFTLAACGGDSGGGSGPIKLKQAVSLQYWSILGGADGTRMRDMTAQYTKEQPMVKIPVVEKQLRDGGFDVTFKLFDPDTQPFFDTVRAGKGDAWIIVHCGSSREPWGTLQHYHSKFASSEQGKQNSYLWANSQYSNKEYDAIIDQMDQILSSPTDAKYSPDKSRII